MSTTRVLEASVSTLMLIGCAHAGLAGGGRSSTPRGSATQALSSGAFGNDNDGRAEVVGSLVVGVALLPFGAIDTIAAHEHDQQLVDAARAARARAAAKPAPSVAMTPDDADELAPP